MNSRTAVISLAVALLVAVGIGAVVLAKPGSLLYTLRELVTGGVSYVSDISNEVDLIDVDLSAVNEEVASGVFDNERAAAARTSLRERLERIKTATEKASEQPLPPGTRGKLIGALTKLTRTLSTYQDALRSIERETRPATSTQEDGSEEPTTTQSTLVRAFIDTAQILEDHVELVTGENIGDNVEIDKAATSTEVEEPNDNTIDSEESVSDAGAGSTALRGTSTGSTDTSDGSASAAGGDVFALTLKPDTVKHFSGKDSRTQENADYWYVPSSNVSGVENPEDIRLNTVQGFAYDPAYEYVITVKRTHSDNFGALDAEWYNYDLISIESKTPVGG